MKPLLYVLIAITGFVYLSCKPCKEVTNTVTEIQTVYRDTILPGATVTQFVTDTFFSTMPINRIIVKKDTSGRAEVRIYRDALNRLQIECEAKDRAAQLKESNTSKATTNTQQQTVYKTPWYVQLMIVALAISCLILGFKLLIKP